MRVCYYLLHHSLILGCIFFIQVNKFVDNIGARRLHTVSKLFGENNILQMTFLLHSQIPQIIMQIIEKVVEDISFNAPERTGSRYVIDKQV